MGEVYRAHDSRLGRDVAIKVLPAAFSADPERLQRFEQEARSAAALNHPNILAVYDIGQHDGAPYIVSELLEGDTLRERLNAGAIPVRKAVEYAIQIAHGVAAAHEKGIVHRDLKPENLFITSDGRVKILDFGLAKLLEATAAPVAVTEAETRSSTHPGVVLGTPGYMAPEQVRGQAVDHRTDVFAFGVLLYEMLAGRPAFQRETTIDTMTAILKDDPPDLPIAERNIPPALGRIVDRCVEKAPAARFQSTVDLAFALEALSSHSGSSQTLTADISEARFAKKRDPLKWALVAGLAVMSVVAVVLGGLAYFRRAPAATEATRFFIAPPDGWKLAARQVQGVASGGPLAVAPDGRQVAFVAQDASGGTQIWVRSLDTLEAKGLAGTERGVSPFWSPDSRSLGFFADGKLKKIDVAGGPPVTLCDAELGVSGSWSRDDVIVFSPAPGTTLQKVSASGGAPAPATGPHPDESHARPFFLPDGRRFLYRVVANASPVFVGSLDSPERTRLLDSVDSTNVIYSQRHLLFVRGSTLMAQPFDPERLALTGEAFPVAEQIQTVGTPPYGFFSASDSGALAYQTGRPAGAPQLTWLDRTGRVLGTVGKPAAFTDVALAPDGRRAVASLPDQRGGSDVWLLDLARDGLATRFTFDAAQNNVFPIWSPDGSQIVFGSTRSGQSGLYRKPASGAGREELLLATDEDKGPSSWSRDGRFLLYTTFAAPGVYALPLTGDRKPVPLFQTPAGEFYGDFSPDGQWIAYASNESGQYEVYVGPFDPSGRVVEGKWQVSTRGGVLPMWGPDGKEIFYVAAPPDSALPDVMVMAAPVSAREAAIDVGAATALFAVRLPGEVRYFYRISPDGKRFLVSMMPVDEATTTPITVVLNWTAGLKK